MCGVVWLGRGAAWSCMAVCGEVGWGGVRSGGVLRCEVWCGSGAVRSSRVRRCGEVGWDGVVTLGACVCRLRVTVS